MAGDTENPRVWVNADVLVADVDTTAPDDTTTAWPAGWESVGLLSEDGMVESRSEDVTDHYAWGGILVRTTRSKHKRTIKVTALEDNPVVFDLVNPGSESETSGEVTTRTVKIPTPDPRAFGFETIDGDITRRRVVPRGEITAVGDVTASDSEMQMFELTIDCYPDADGVIFIDITDDPQAAAGS
jgi:hypothetical protein